MKCDICKIHEAVMFVRQVSASSSIELHLCVACAKERGLSAADGKIEMSLGGLLSGLLDGSNTAVVRERTKVCATCGMSLFEISKQKRCGCPDCYLSFKDEIFTLLRKDGITGSYTGSLPNRIADFKSSLTDRMALQTKLEQAVSVEDYEKAAVYRDRLRQLETSGFVSSGAETAEPGNADPHIMKEGADE